MPFAPAALPASFTAWAANPRSAKAPRSSSTACGKKTAQSFNLRLCFLCFLHDIRDGAGALHDIACDRSKKMSDVLKTELRRPALLDFVAKLLT
jgi:hypothetical protein